MPAMRRITDGRYYVRLLKAINSGQIKIGTDYRYYNHLPRRVADVDDTVYAACYRGWVELLAGGDVKVTGDGQKWLDDCLSRPGAQSPAPRVARVVKEPRHTCPTCHRPDICVVRRSQRMRPHDHPDGGECAGSWSVIDLYGAHPTGPAERTTP